MGKRLPLDDFRQAVKETDHLAEDEARQLRRSYYSVFGEIPGVDRDWHVDHYEGEWGDLSQYAENLVDEGIFGDIPDRLASYIDYGKIANDLDCEGYVIEAGYLWRP